MSQDSREQHGDANAGRDFIGDETYHREARSRPASPIARLIARNLADRRALVRKLIVGDAMGERVTGPAGPGRQGKR